jgi:nitrogen fixation/metabolism regulation signal transduction histidine kinase
MLKKLGKTITIANAVAFLIVIMVGGVSIYFTKDILQNAYAIEGLSKDILTIDSIHSDAYRLILSIHHFLIDPDELYAEESIETIAALKRKVENYKRGEIAARDGDAEHFEIVYLDTMLQDINGLNKVKEFFDDFSVKGEFDKDRLVELEEFAYELEDTSDKINKIHTDMISQLTSQSLRNMWLILFIYLFFITTGGLAIYIGHVVLLRKVVNPIKELAAATIEFAGGNLEKRVYTDSRTEIGQLYESFNRMAEKLQENDEILRKFNEKLERKVKERTLALQEANEKLSSTHNALIRTERIAAVGQIAAGVTHEIKNPLNSLSINAQMLIKELSKKYSSESTVIESASLIRYEINRINNILEEFVKFAKFPEPRFYENSMNDVVCEVAELISSSARESNVSVQLSLQDDIPRFMFDARQFKEVFINLSQNAIKAMENGGVLEFVTSLDSENVIIKVVDSGPGIPEKNREKIFTPFFSTKEGGLGLGLPIVQRIIESHAGRISFTSNEGQGTTFEISIPLQR